MHNRALHDTLAAFVEEAAWQLAEEVAAGAEIPFELIEQGRASAPLYCYRPLTDRFIAEHLGMLERLPSYPAAAQGLAALPNLSAYLIARGRRTPAATGAPRATPRSRRSSPRCGATRPSSSTSPPPSTRSTPSSRRRSTTAARCRSCSSPSRAS